jgi:hypothetical protein
MNPKTKTLLRRAIKVLENNGWLRHEFAQDIDGNRINVTNAKACKFCASGALYRAKHELHYGVNSVHEAFKVLSSALSVGGIQDKNIVGFNDYLARSKEDVIAVFKKALGE